MNMEEIFRELAAAKADLTATQREIMARYLEQAQKRAFMGGILVGFIGAAIGILLSLVVWVIV